MTDTAAGGMRSVGQFASVAGVNNYNADALMYSRKTAMIANG